MVFCKQVFSGLNEYVNTSKALYLFVFTQFYLLSFCACTAKLELGSSLGWVSLYTKLSFLASGSTLYLSANKMLQDRVALLECLLSPEFFLIFS